MKAQETSIKMITHALDAGAGILRLKPTWVPRTFTTPGARLRLEIRDLYAFGAHRGGICERWIASTTKADNGEYTREDEGLSYVSFEGSEMLLSHAFAAFGRDLIGDADFDKQGAWNVLCKLFDNVGMVPHHVHHDAVKAARVGRQEKPESYYFPPQLNHIEHSFPLTFFGLLPEVTKGQIKDCLAKWDDGDNRITDLSAAYRLRPGSGWQVDPGILHAPGSLATYTIEKNSDVFSMFQNMVGDRLIPWELVVKNVPDGAKKDLDYIVDLLHWEANIDHDFVRRYKRDPIAISSAQETAETGYAEKWITYGRSDYSAKELTVLPGRSCVIPDAAAYGALIVQGHGKMGPLVVKSPSVISFGSLTLDELFVSYPAATVGVNIQNDSPSEPLVILKHFGPDNPESDKFVKRS